MKNHELLSEEEKKSIDNLAKSYKDFEKTFNHPTGNKKIIKAGNLDTTFYIYKRNMPEQKILKNQKKTENKNYKHKVNKEKY